MKIEKEFLLKTIGRKVIFLIFLSFDAMCVAIIALLAYVIAYKS